MCKCLSPAHIMPHRSPSALPRFPDTHILTSTTHGWLCLHTQQHTHTAPQLTRTDTWHHAQTPIHSASRHTSPRPHMSHTCHYTPTRMPTPLTWPAARGTFRHPCHLSFYPRGAVRSQERELQPFPDLMRTLFLGEPYPAHPDLLHHSPFLRFQKVPSGQELKCEAEQEQWKGSTQAGHKHRCRGASST